MFASAGAAPTLPADGGRHWWVPWLEIVPGSPVSSLLISHLYFVIGVPAVLTFLTVIASWTLSVMLPVDATACALGGAASCTAASNAATTAVITSTAMPRLRRAPARPDDAKLDAMMAA